MSVGAPGAASRTVVVDASLALKWVLTESDSAVALQMLSDWQASGVRLIAPLLLAAEAANAVYKRVRAGQLTLADAQVALGALLMTEIAYDTDPNLSLQAVVVAHHYGLRATYDAHYLALAQSTGVELWTGDQNLINALQARRPTWLRSIADYAIPPGTP